MTDMHPTGSEPERHTAIRADVAELFRAEALEEYQRGRRDEAHLLEIEPAWMSRAWLVILALLGVALLVGLLLYTGLLDALPAPRRPR